MTDLRSALEAYLSMRKGLGYKYQHQTRRLAAFVSFMEQRKAMVITAKLAMEWATLPPDRHASWALRLTDVRGFARHVANFAVFEVLVPVLQLIEASDFVDLLETFRRRYLRLEAINAGRQVLQPHRQSLIY